MVQKIKCVIWDLDNTIWDGVLSEDKEVKLNDNIKEIIEELDKRGILQSVASKNNYDDAMAKLREFGLDEYFLYPQITWDAKSESVRKIREQINIGMDSITFIDDQQFELEEVSFSNPEALCINANEVSGILNRDEFQPRFITSDSRNRRIMYMNDIKRKEEEESYKGYSVEFLKSLNMYVDVSYATVEDIKRVEELTVRTHQLNSTGYTYTYEELCKLIDSDNYKLLIVSLKDRFGSYGKIGIILLEMKEDNVIIKLFLLSCRVMSRGIGSILMNVIKKEVQKHNKKLFAEFISNEKNRMMKIMLMFNGFEESEQENLLVCKNLSVKEDMDHITINNNL